MPTVLMWKDDSGATESVRLDIVTAETHEALMAITDHPVEEGANVVDHARPEPERVTIEGFVSNKPIFSNPGVEKFMDFETVELDLPEKQGGAPIFTPGGLTQAVGGLFGGSQNKATVLRAGSPRDRVADVYSKLTEARLKRRQITIESRIDVYVDMLIERLAIPRTPEDGNGAVFQLDLRRVRFVKSQTVQAPEPAEARGALRVSKGSKATEADKNDAKKAEKAQSIAKSLFNGGSSLLDAVGF